MIPIRLLAAAFALVLLVATGCGTVVTESKGTPPNAPAEDEAQETSTKSDGDASGGPEDEDASRQEVTDLFLWIFDGSQGDIQEKLDSVYNVDAVADTLVQVMEANADIFAVLTADVKSVEFPEDERANVTFDLLVEGDPTLSGANGDAIFTDGEWKIDAQLMCDLVALADSSVPCIPDESAA